MNTVFYADTRVVRHAGNYVRPPDDETQSLEKRKKKKLSLYNYSGGFRGAIVMCTTLVGPECFCNCNKYNATDPWPNAGHLFQLVQVPPIRFQGAFVDIFIIYLHICIRNASLVLTGVYIRIHYSIYASRLYVIDLYASCQNNEKY